MLCIKKIGGITSMKKRVEFVMNPDEYGQVANIVGTERNNAEKMADKLLKEDMPKEQIADFLYDIATQLAMAENILTDI